MVAEVFVLGDVDDYLWDWLAIVAIKQANHDFGIIRLRDAMRRYNSTYAGEDEKNEFHHRITLYITEIVGSSGVAERSCWV